MAAKNYLPVCFLSFIIIFLAYAIVMLLSEKSWATPKPLTQPGCYYQQVQCIKAPCDPVLVCPKPTSSPQTGCQVGGCSGQLCVDANEPEPQFTTCEYRADYACYKTATCARQPSGLCGWTQTQQLQRCLQSPPPLR